MKLLRFYFNFTFSIAFFLACIVGGLLACSGSDKVPASASGVTKLTVMIPTNVEGQSIEQVLIAERLKRDNQPGAFKYVYVINTYTGTVMYQSIAVGKVVSSGKRLTPTMSAQIHSTLSYDSGFPIDIGDQRAYTPEVLQDDGTYGSSSEYLFWFDPQNGYHQVYSNAVYLHVSSIPLVVRNATLTMEVDTNAPPIGNIAPEIQRILQEFGIQP